VANGIPLLQGLEVVSKSVTNAVLQKELEEVWQKVREGSALAEALTQSGQFPPFVTNMIAVGEEAGSLEKALFKVADAYDREVDRVTQLFTTLLGPVLILVMAFVVGFIVVSMLLPIFEFQGLLQ
jgi:type II secretory pathway component PulF